MRWNWPFQPKIIAQWNRRRFQPERIFSNMLVIEKHEKTSKHVCNKPNAQMPECPNASLMFDGMNLHLLWYHFNHRSKAVAKFNTFYGHSDSMHKGGTAYRICLDRKFGNAMHSNFFGLYVLKIDDTNNQRMPEYLMQHMGSVHTSKTSKHSSRSTWLQMHAARILVVLLLVNCII